MSAAYDFIIVGTGAGGGTLLYALRDIGAKVLVVERGDFLPAEDENWQAKAVFAQKRYKPKEQWIDASNGSDFQPGVHYFVGGNTKVYGAALPRLRRETLARWNMKAARHSPGRSATKTWSHTIAGRKRFMACMDSPAMTRRNRRVPPPILTRRSPTNLTLPT